jgi:transcriptional regulator with XRE-family HTH domain
MISPLPSPDQAATRPVTLTQQVCRILAEKALSVTDVELRAGGKISYSLIAAIAAGDCENLRFETLRALAKGLGVAHERLFGVAIGQELEEFQEADFVALADKYLALANEDQAELESLLALLDREIERLLVRQKYQADRNRPCAMAAPKRLSLAAPNGESFRDFVCRTLKEKRLTLEAVQQRSRRKISASYLSNMVHYRAHNLTIEKIKALALGLGVTALEIFTILEGPLAPVKQAFTGSLFATLYHKYQTLLPAGKKELHLMMRLVDQEIDRRQMQKIRHAEIATWRRRGKA